MTTTTSTHTDPLLTTNYSDRGGTPPQSPPLPGTPAAAGLPGVVPTGTHVHIRDVLECPLFALAPAYVATLVGRIEQRFELYGQEPALSLSGPVPTPPTTSPTATRSVPSRGCSVGCSPVEETRFAFSPRLL